MEFVKSYNDFKGNNFISPVFEWSEKLRCLKINDFYLYVDQQILLEKNQFSDNNRLNELFGVDFSDFLPNSTSDFLHLGVDGISALSNAIPGVGATISVVLDIIHSVSYFIEGKVKNNEETNGLYICGAITAALPFFSLPAVRNVVGSVIRVFSKMLKPGKFLLTALKYLMKLPFKIATDVLKFLFRADLLQKGIAKILNKHQGTWWFKLLSKVPVVKQVIEFVKDDLTKAFLKTTEIMVKDLDLYKVGLRNHLNKTYPSLYKKLDRSIMSIIDEKTYMSLSMELVDKELKTITKDSVISANNPLFKFKGKMFQDGLMESTHKVISDAATQVNNGIGAHLNNKILNKLMGKSVKREAVIYAIKNGGKEIPYSVLIKNAILKLPKNLFVKIPSVILKRFGIAAAKTYVAEPKKEVSDIKPEEKSTVEPTDRSKYEAEDEIKDNTEIVQGENSDFVELKEKYNLKVGTIKDINTLGSVTLAYRVPERSREEDDDTGKLIIEENEIFNQIDITSSLKDYENVDVLLTDLKLIGKKDEEKESLREREFKKWQKSTIRSTPYIESMKCRFEFYFVSRERSKISFFKKNHEEEINLSEFLGGIENRGNLKLNGSLFLIAKKISE